MAFRSSTDRPRLPGPPTPPATTSPTRRRLVHRQTVTQGSATRNTAAAPSSAPAASPAWRAVTANLLEGPGAERRQPACGIRRLQPVHQPARQHCSPTPTPATPALNEFFGALQNVTSNLTNVAARQALPPAAIPCRRASAPWTGVSRRLRKASRPRCAARWRASTATLPRSPNERMVISRTGGAGSPPTTCSTSATPGDAGAQPPGQGEHGGAATVRRRSSSVRAEPGHGQSRRAA